jgi:hypothetical protein
MESSMARRDRKKGREDKKPKQPGGKMKPQSAYAARQAEALPPVFKHKNK